MAKRGYKLQEFVAHTTNVNCLSIGKKACRLLITGGDDHKVNLWAIGKPTSLMSLCGHTSPVESVAFDTREVLVLGGASTGVIKLWDLEEAKMVRGLTGHRSNCTAVEFHPFGEFFASGSMDTNLKIWDIRKKGCIHTYKGHTRGIGTIRFTPDGRWVVSGGFDNVVKVWDLTAGKLLHDFKFHEGHIRSIDFHPLEFLLATGSADRTVKFWDLETFELIGSSRPEGTGVQTITFHPDGRSLFCGLDDGLKVYSWEPVICHDTVDMGWSALGDLCINEGKLVGCSYYRNAVGVWVADISLIEPYGTGSNVEKNESMEKKFDLLGNHSSEKGGNAVRSTSTLRCTSPDYETKEIKNIYIDSSGGHPAVLRRTGSLNSAKLVPLLDSKEITNLTVEKQSASIGLHAKSTGQGVSKSFTMPSVIPRDIPLGKESPNSGKESITFSRTKPGMLLRPANARRPSSTKLGVEKLSVAADGTLKNTKVESDSVVNPKSLVLEDGARESCDEKVSDIKGVAEKFEKVLSPETPTNQVNGDDRTKETNSIKFVNGVAVVPGRTRTLVERFERREKLNASEDKTADVTPTQAAVTTQSQSTNMITNDTICSTSIQPTNVPATQPNTITRNQQAILAQSQASNTRPEQTIFVTSIQPKTPNQVTSTVPKQPAGVTLNPPIAMTLNKPMSMTLSQPTSMILNQATHMTPIQPTNMTHHVVPERDTTSTTLNGEHQISGRDLTTVNNVDLTESLMQAHDVFLSTLRSRLTKLQVVRHFWERKDIKGAIGALRKLPDHAVQADVISVLMEKMEILTLDIFSCLLPVLSGLIDSKIERHANISLEMLLKLVAVFGPVISSTIAAPRVVGVDLHAEQRLECCNRCFMELQKVKTNLPALTRKGGMLARKAQELTLVLQES